MRNLQIGVDKAVGMQSLLCHSESATYLMSKIINESAVVVEVVHLYLTSTTAALLCKHITVNLVVNNQSPTQY